MSDRVIRSFTILGICICLALWGTGCSATKGGIQVERGEKKKGGPPPHAPAHGYRAKHSYRYYPCSQVYFDVSRKVYFYLEGAQWKMSVSLPHSFRVKWGDYVTIDMDTDRPYMEHQEHKKKYPPGSLKKKKNKKKRWQEGRFPPKGDDRKVASLGYQGAFTRFPIGDRGYGAETAGDPGQEFGEHVFLP